MDVPLSNYNCTEWHIILLIKPNFDNWFLFVILTPVLKPQTAHTASILVWQLDKCFKSQPDTFKSP